MLTLPNQKLQRIKAKLSKTLTRDGALVTEIAPQTLSLIGNQHISDYQKLKVRLEKAFQLFITIAATELYPLIIAVDDLQWADNASWRIISSIADPLLPHNIYVILAYRNNTVGYRNKVNSLLQTLDLGRALTVNLERLTLDAVRTLLTEVFAGQLQDTDKLLWLTYRKTAGNPLYLKQMLNLLLQNRGIYYPGQWAAERNCLS